MAYLTLADLKTYLDIQTTADDTLLSSLITAAERAIDDFTHRTFEATSDTTRYFDAVRDTNKDVLFLDDDLFSITSIINDGDTLTAADYTVIPRNVTPIDRIRITCDKAWCYSDCSTDAIEVTGLWAYSDRAPDPIVQATRRLAAFYYRQKDSQVFNVVSIPELGEITAPPGMPDDVKIILLPYVKQEIG